MDPSAALVGPVRTVLNSVSLVAPRAAGRVAFDLFRHPIRRGKLRGEEREVHQRAVVDQLAVNGKPVAVYRWGSGHRPVLLLHGWQSRTSRFAPLVPRLQALGFSPIGFDAPGHGESGGRATTILEYRELIGRLQDRYGTFEAVVAHSFGVNCAFLALRSGIRAHRLVAIAGVAEFRYLVDAFRSRLGLNARIEADLVRRIEQVLFAEAGTGTSTATGTSAGTSADTSTGTSAGTGTGTGGESVWERFDATRRPEEVDLPILVVHDEGDPTVPLDQAHRLKAAFGDRLELLTTRGLGHRRVLREPAVLDNVIGFLTEATDRVRA